MKKLIAAVLVVVLSIAAAVVAVPLVEKHAAAEIKVDIERDGTTTVEAVEVGLFARSIAVTNLKGRRLGEISIGHWQASGLAWPIGELIKGRTPLSGLQLGDPLRASRLEARDFRMVQDEASWTVAALVIEDFKLERYDPTLGGPSQFTSLTARIANALSMGRLEQKETVFADAAKGDRIAFTAMTVGRFEKGQIGSIAMAGMELTPKAAKAPLFRIADLSLTNLDLRRVSTAIGTPGWRPGTPVGRVDLDGASVSGTYIPTGKVGTHDVDPLNPGQGCLDPLWGNVEPFSPSHSFHYVSHAPPTLGSHAYAVAFNDVKTVGGDGITTSTSRTQEQTEIGLFWAYDGSPKLGVPPRLYNQIVRTIAIQERNTEIENARLFALVNAAMADAGILCWDIKYQYVIWRPILGVRRADEDGNLSTVADHNWTPLGAPASNRIGINFTPNFPSYSSGHATFGAALFRTLQHFYGTDHLPFSFVSDELNGSTTDSQGSVRPLRPRHFHRLSDAAYENARSRMYLGIHWQFDADEGMRSGTAIGDHVFHSILQRR